MSGVYGAGGARGEPWPTSPISQPRGQSVRAFAVSSRASNRSQALISAAEQWLGRCASRIGRVSDPRARLVVLISGTGSNLQALIDATAEDYPAQVVAVGADRAGITGLDRAAAAGIPTFVVDPADHRDRVAWDQELTRQIQRFEPDWVVSAGFMRILREEVLRAFPDQIVNTHPALLPAFPGAHAVRDAIAYGVKVTGCTIHLVDAGVDTGPVLAQASVDMQRDDNEASLHERIKVLERELLVDTIERLCRQSLSISGRQVWFQ